METLTRSVDGRLTGRRRIVVAALIPMVVLLIGAAIRIAMRPKRDFDEHLFMHVGRHILELGVPLDTYTHPEAPAFFFDHTPLYVYFVGLLTALPGPTVLILRGSSLVFGLMTVGLVFLIALRLRGLGSALVGSVLVAANPFFITYSWFIRMEVPLTFFLVLAVYFLISERFLLAGLAIATAVMLKEIALAFWLVATAYVLWRHGRRAALSVGLPAPIAVLAWLAYAASLDFERLRTTLERWGRSAAGNEADNRRFRIGPLAWTQTILSGVIGGLVIFAAGIAAALAATFRDRIPPITIVPAAYIVVAVAASYVMSLKEPRFLIAIVPMLALCIALAVDWGEAWSRARSGGAGGRAGVVAEGG
jgi:4-amino-4-deoxy-L-arabinose transferase-like glycosyltransferase